MRLLVRARRPLSSRANSLENVFGHTADVATEACRGEAIDLNARESVAR